MPPPTAATGPWQDLEQQAYHAYREWPIWLVLRERELAQRRGSARSEQRTPSPAPAGANAQPAADRPPGKAEPE